MIDLRRGQKPPFGDRTVGRDRVFLDDAEDARRTDFGAAVVKVVIGVVPEVALGRNRADLGNAPEGGGVFEREILAAQLPFRPRAPRPEAGLVFLEQDESRPEALEAVDHVVVEAGHDGDHRDDRRDTDHDSEDGERGAQLVCPDGQQGESDVLAETAPKPSKKTRHRS